VERYRTYSANGPQGSQTTNNRRVLNGIFWVLRTGAPWRDLPERYGPYTSAYNRFNRWRKGEAHGVSYAEALLEGLEPCAVVIADKA
jgi:transposase